MSNIHQVLSEGQAIQLGPVKVTKTYPRKAGDKNRFLLIEDASGKGALKIWGAAANTELQEGQMITLIGTGPKGGLKTSEFNGKTSIDANDVRLEIGGQASYGHQAPSQPAQGSTEHVGYNEPREQVRAATGGSGGIIAVARQAAKGTVAYINALEAEGLSRDEALMIAQGAHNMYPVYWGGEKFLN